jgi:cysteine-rich repeat protein
MPRVAACGNRKRDPGELCDDGNVASGDGCSSICAIEAGYQCPAPGGRCIPICGDGMLKGTENCDDGNSSSEDGCSANCLTEPGWDCTSGVCVRISSGDAGQAAGGYLTCGDGIISGAEECDDGPRNLATVDTTLGYDSCLANCKYGERCGDGVVSGPEECDDAANDGTYGTCNPDCTLGPRCGDGVVQDAYGEECEPKTPDDRDCASCRKTAGCGDGAIQPPEQCDDGALLNDGHYGGCAPSCIFAPHCGDCIKNGPEECDDCILDGSYGGCTPDCKLGPHCGDGIVNGNEECDHGPDNGVDGACGTRCCQACFVPP